MSNNTDNNEALLIAAEDKDWEKVRKLIAEGADVNAEDVPWGETVLMYAARYNENPKVIKELIAAGADVNAKDNDGCTALMISGLLFLAANIKAVLP